MSLFPVEGGCQCGFVRYRIVEEPLATGICHCRSCQRSAGAESVAWAVNQDAAFELTAGEPSAFASSPGVERTFCPQCGTSLTYRNGPESIDVTLASLDDPEALPPTREVWCEDRVSWNALSAELEHYQQRSGTRS